MLNMIELSTARLSAETLNNYLQREHLPVSVWAGPYGSIVSARAFETESYTPRLPEDLQAVQAYALALGADYILFDRDADDSDLPGIDALPSFDW